MANLLEITGDRLRIEDVERVSGDDSPEVRLGEAARPRVEASRDVIERVVAEERTVYGVTTGFGLLSDVVIPPERIRELQTNLLRSHAPGLGPPLPEPEARAVVLLRANVLALGHSGVRPVVIERLLDLLNRRVHPVIPERGSVGASGDLAPLSHLALVLIGEGEAFHEGERLEGGEALRRAGLEPLTLEAKEGIALNNGTQFQAGVGVRALAAAERAVEVAEVAGAMSLEGMRGTPVAFDERLQRARPHPGQLTSGERLRGLLADSEIRESHREDDPRVQDAYSLRCMPQVHGAARNGLDYIRGVLEIEINSATDNPLIFPEEGDVVSGGNFHGQPVAQVLDLLAMVCADLASISERRLARLVDPALSGGLPAFLSPDPGINSGLMIVQIAAASLVNELKLKAQPASVDSISTDANKEDHVSMGALAAVKAREAVRLLESVLALELLAGAQALEFLKPMRPGRGVERAYRNVREHVRPLERDRDMAPDIKAIEALVRDGSLSGIAAGAEA